MIAKVMYQQVRAAGTDIWTVHNYLNQVSNRDIKRDRYLNKRMLDLGQLRIDP